MKVFCYLLFSVLISFSVSSQEYEELTEEELQSELKSSQKPEYLNRIKYWLGKKFYKNNPETNLKHLEEAYQGFIKSNNSEYEIKSASQLYKIYLKLQDNVSLEELDQTMSKKYGESDDKYFTYFLNAKFNSAVKTGDQELIESTREKFYNFVEKTKSNLASAHYYKTLGMSHYYQGDFKGAGENFEKSAEFMEKSPEESWGDDKPGVYMNAGIILYKNGQLDDALRVFRKSVKAFKKNDNQLNVGHAYINMASVYSDKSQLDSLRWVISKAIEAYRSVNDTTGIIHAKEYLGNGLKNEGKLDECLEMHLEILKLRKQMGKGMFNSYSNISGVYESMKDTIQQLYFIRLAENEAEKSGNQMQKVSVYSKFGNYFRENGQKDSSLFYHNEQLKICEEQNNQHMIASAYLSIGNVHKRYKDIDVALDYYMRSYDIFLQLNNEAQIAGLAHNIGAIYEERKEFAKALTYINKSYELRKKMQNTSYMLDSYHTLSNVYTGLGRYKESNELLWKYVNLKDSLFTSDMSKQIAEMRTIYETQQIEDSLALSQKSEENALIDNKRIEAEKETANLERDKADTAKKNQFWMFGAGLLAALIVVFFVIRASQQRKRANSVLQTKNDEILGQNQEIRLQKEIIEEKNKDILDSITYAKRLQEAILPPRKLVKQNLNKSFILFMPKDIVSGDFYWMQPTNQGVLYAVADCTGHGVPGAMVSMVGHNALNRAVKEFGKTKPSEILDTINTLVEETFSQSEEGVKDGMDIALCKYNPDNKELQFSGANNPLWVVSKRKTLQIGDTVIEPNKESGQFHLFEVKGNKQPIGAYDDRVPFTNHSLQLDEGDSVYTFSDGYADQFGGQKGKKFKYSTLKMLLMEMQHLPIEDQRQKMFDVMNEWKSDYEQLDDICFIGIQA